MLTELMDVKDNKKKWGDDYDTDEGEMYKSIPSNTIQVAEKKDSRKTVQFDLKEKQHVLSVKSVEKTK